MFLIVIGAEHYVVFRAAEEQLAFYAGHHGEQRRETRWKCCCVVWLLGKLMMEKNTNKKYIGEIILQLQNSFTVTMPYLRCIET